MGAELPYLFISNNADNLVLNAMGVAISLYSLYIEIAKERDPTYRALCDFNDYMSCSKVLTSKYSVGFGVMHFMFGRNHVLNSRNCNLGIVFYIINICVGLLLSPTLSAPIQFYGSVVSLIGSAYLAIVLFFVLKDFCLVCITIYVINGCLLYVNHAHWSQHQL